MLYLQLAIAPVILILIYIYYRDKYNKEPFGLLLLLFVAGMFSVVPILGVGYISDLFIGNFDGYYRVAYTAFIQAGFIEEFFKFFFVFLIAWWSKAFDERFDGIVYAVFVSMGFAVVENIMYVFGYGYETGLLRMVTAVSAHAIFGISMGYYLGKAKFDKDFRIVFLFLAFIVPWLLHGFYNFVLMAEVPWLLLVFVVYLIFMYFLGFKKMSLLSKYKTKPVEEPQQTFRDMDEQQVNSEQLSQPNDSEQKQSGFTTNSEQQANTNFVPPQAQGQPYAQYQPHQHYYQVAPPKNNLDNIAIFHYVWGGLKLFASLFVLIYVVMGIAMLIGGVETGETEMQFTGGVLLVVGIISFLVVIALGILSLLCGRFLQKRKNRIFCLVMAGFACLNAPLGTVLGVFTIIELEKPEIKVLFEQNKGK